MINTRMKLIVTQYAHHQARYLPFFFVGQQSVYLLNDLDLVSVLFYFLLLMKNYVCLHTHTHTREDGSCKIAAPFKRPLHFSQVQRSTPA